MLRTVQKVFKYFFEKHLRTQKTRGREEGGREAQQRISRVPGIWVQVKVPVPGPSPAENNRVPGPGSPRVLFSAVLPYVGRGKGYCFLNRTPLCVCVCVCVCVCLITSRGNSCSEYGPHVCVCVRCGHPKKMAIFFLLLLIQSPCSLPLSFSLDRYYTVALLPPD